MSNLALAYRPRTLDEIAGQRAVSALLKAMLVKGTLPNVLLLEGVKGSGKTTVARILAAALNCQEDNKPCGQCESCLAVFEGRSMAVREIDASSHGLVDDIRTLQESLMYTSPGSTAVVTLDEAHGMSKAASNALLKTLEFPPDNTVFILITTESSKILSTIRSRCMSFVFRRISAEDIYKRLMLVKDKENLTIDDDVVYQISLRSKGSLRDGLILMDQLTRAGVHNIKQYRLVLGDTSVGPTLLATILTGRHSQAFSEIDAALEQLGTVQDVMDCLIDVFKDVVVLKSGGSVAPQGDDLRMLEQLSTKLDTKKAVAALRALWDTKIKVRGNDQSVSVLYLTVTAIIDAISVPIAEDSPGRALTFGDLRGIVSETAS